MLLRLTDGTTTLTLSGSGAYLGATYFPANQASGDRITESAALILEGTEAAVRTAAQAVDLLLRAAPAAGERARPPLYVEFRPIDSGEIRRARVYGGFTNWSQVAAERSLSGSLNTVRIVATWERATGWQGAEVELPLWSSVSAEGTGGVTAYNDDNGGVGFTNWVAVGAANVLGTQPAPIRLRIANASGGARQWETFHIGGNAYSSPASADLWLLGSEAVGGAAKSWSAGVTHSSLQWIFSLSSTLLGQTQGRTFRVLAAFTSLSSTATLRAAVGTYLSSVFVASRTGGERNGVRELVDLGEFAIPPGGYDVGNAGAALVVTVRSASAGSGTLDFVMLMPTDGYRKLEQAGFAAANGDAIEIDDIDGGAWLLSGSSRYAIVRASGEGLVVHPGRENRIYILFDEGANFVAGRQMTVRAWYRPVYDNV
jgi:hypothetical protein